MFSDFSCELEEGCFEESSIELDVICKLHVCILYIRIGACMCTNIRTNTYVHAPAGDQRAANDMTIHPNCVVYCLHVGIKFI